MRQKILTFIFVLFLIFSIPVQASESVLNVYFFWGDGCPHCEKEKPFLEKLESENENIKVYRYEVWKNRKNLDLMVKVGKELKLDISGVPVTIIGDEAFVGYSEGFTSKQIESRIGLCLDKGCKDSVASLVGLEEKVLISDEEAKEEMISSSNGSIPDSITLPVVGTINIKGLSLPFLTILLGGLDGFNPCAMWTLIFLISLLLGMEDRKRMWILGSTFIVASAFVYFMFMAAWLNLILFLGFIVWVRIGIGLLALVGGGYNLKEYFENQDNTCKVTGSERRQKVFQKLKKITQEESFWLAFVGIILLAFAVNLVELVCSAGLPAVYTQVLALSNLSNFQYYSYISLYIFFFMLDDLVVFFIAMLTLQTIGLTTKYVKWSHLIGGILMIVIGFLLILRPELLMFG